MNRDRGPPARSIAVLYATREGHTQRVAQHVAARLRARGMQAVLTEVPAWPPTASLRGYAGVVLAASVHRGQHEPEMLAFVRARRDELRALPSAFLSVTLSQAGAQRTDASAEEHAKFVADVAAMGEGFVAMTGWRPQHLVPVAGALRYSRYNFLVRLMMKRIAREAGGSTDTSRDHDYTDWAALDRFVDAFAAEVNGGVPGAAPRA